MIATCNNSKCKQNNPQLAEAFSKYAKGINGLNPRCKSCIKEYYHIYYYENGDKMKEKSKRKYQKNKHLNSFNSLRYRESKRFTSAKCKYNLLKDDYKKLLEKQNNLCAICKNPETTLDKRRNKIRDLAIDHDHKTNKVRGLLCGNCNRGIGMLKDSIENLNNAINYLKEHNESISE